jgi:hypothetical protein
MTGEANKTTAKTPPPPSAPALDSATLEKLLDRLATAVEAIRTERHSDAGAIQGVAERTVEAISSLRPKLAVRTFPVQEAVHEHEDLAKKLAGPDFGTASRSPAITEVFPGQGPPGTRVVIQGRSLSDATSVKFGPADATPEAARPGRLEVVVPKQAKSGRPVVVTGRGLEAESQQEFNVT